MFNPTATYRLQFHKDFTFKDFEKILPYLKDMGVSTIYASPIFHSTPGSTHGYDTLNPLAINPEIGLDEDLRRISRKLSEENIEWLQDIVPNHMAFDPRNPWLNDVLEKGQKSLYASFFDIDWQSEVYGGKLMVPFLGDSLDKVIENGEVELTLDKDQLAFKNYDLYYPANFTTYQEVMKDVEQADSRETLKDASSIDYSSTDFNQLFKDLKKSFAGSLRNQQIKKSIEQNLSVINEDKKLLRSLLNQQHYVLCHWQQTDTKINFRRFFTVNGLISLNMHDRHVFDHFHQLIKKLVAEGIVKGLRVDHIDGLLDPTKYLERLRSLAGEDVYINVEKILQPDESIPFHWKIEGNTGYDFLAIVNNLFTNKKKEKQLSAFYNNLVPSKATIKSQLHDKKRFILYQHMQGDLENLYQLFLSINHVEKSSLKNIAPEDLKKAIGEFLVYCPVYRYYGNSFPLDAEESKAVQQILVEVKKEFPGLSAAIEALSAAFFLPHENEQKEKAVVFYQRCMQFSGPLMAKGFEDTLMYTFNRFVAHNEVGDSPGAFGYSINEFHNKMKERQKRWPLSINTTSTHDTKRGEDARARLNVLSDVEEQWIQKVTEWFKLAEENEGKEFPDNNDRYFIYQTFFGHYPMPGEGDDDFKNRISEYLQKSLREAKTHSNWTTPNEEYENATKKFATRLLDKNKPFWKSFESFHNSLVDYGIINSLTQVLLKFTCPGLPDVYQGTELWDLSFVDPDNRRAVDYNKRAKLLEDLQLNQDNPDFFKSLWNERYTGKIKLWLAHRLFQLRKQHTTAFTEGDYIQLDVKGKYKDYIIAFARTHRQQVFIVAASLHLAEICSLQKKEWRELDWADTKIILPNNILASGENVLSSQTISFGNEIEVKNIFLQLPFSILKGALPSNERGAGILMHISSLPSAFGIGDLGPQAKSFADFLHRGYQKYWQLLPLNPTEEGQGHSPYSSTSSMAGNTLFISPENLVQDGLLDKKHLERPELPSTDKVNYQAAVELKKELLESAWKKFNKEANSSPDNEFESFCKKEKAWLDDYSLFTILKDQFGGKPWYDWPDKYKFRDSDSLKELLEKFPDEFQKVKWFQYIFLKQWKELKKYCNKLQIQFVGDLPFYVSYDSADVWANPGIFKLDAKGNRTGVAGVPPDAFSEDGQLWGMPVFRWDVLKKDRYKWWTERLRKNIELFDLTRLDHFRAFSAYWEVLAKEKTAKKGKWIKGPGVHFFKHIKHTLGELPFIAEDLGEIDEPVYKLRDQFGLPGMKVLQFAFGEDMPSSLHIPHNYTQNFFVYTGTHDNNTVLGWWKKEAGQNHVEEYCNQKITEDKICPGANWISLLNYCTSMYCAYAGFTSA